MENILQLKHLHKKFGVVHAVNDLSFSIKKGNIYGILGPNGSGKSTTLGMVLNVVNPTSGSFKWLEGEVDTHDALKKVGAIIERPNFYPYMTAYQNLALVCNIKDISESAIAKKLEMVHLLERKDSKFSTFSLGMKQRLAIASALLNDPEILILDEPTNGLDPQGINEIRNIIIQVAQKGTTILLASHILDEVEKVCSHVIVLREGKKLYEGRTDEMTKTYGVIELMSKASNIQKLLQLLSSYDGIGSLKTENKIIYATLNKDVFTATLNKYLFENGIILSHLQKRKPTLEQQFLEIIN